MSLNLRYLSHPYVVLLLCIIVHVVLMMILWSHANWSQNDPKATSSQMTYQNSSIHVKWLHTTSQPQVETKNTQPSVVHRTSSIKNHSQVIESHTSKQVVMTKSKSISKNLVKSQAKKPSVEQSQNSNHSHTELAIQVESEQTEQPKVNQQQIVNQSSHTNSASHQTQVESVTSAKTSSIKAISRRVNYPNRARALGVEGKVTVQFDISESGTVKNINVLSETPSGVFADAVRQDMSRWRYETSQSVVNQKVTILFKLSGQVVVENN